MTLETLIDQSLTQATASLSLAHQIRASLQAPEHLWRFTRPLSF